MQVDLSAPKMEFELNGYTNRVIQMLWDTFIEEHLKPSWEKRAAEIERHLQEKARMQQMIDELQRQIANDPAVVEKYTTRGNWEPVIK